MEINPMEIILKYLPLLIPIALLQFGLMFAALVDVIRREKTKGPKWVWIIVVVFINLFGPIVYFIFGRDE
ncbi:MAG: PLD nuclease N-terminal domain-containing protein [Anaerolineaceae bacterium]|nr:PLD nuclease N-terminal domain-containing protein [Anaerolineaceae bacterium]